MEGRVVETIYILKYFNEEDLRNRVRLQLNRGEHRHSLARWIFFADQGEFRTGDYQDLLSAVLARARSFNVLAPVGQRRNLALPRPGRGFGRNPLRRIDPGFQAPRDQPQPLEVRSSAVDPVLNTDE